VSNNPAMQAAFPTVMLGSIGLFVIVGMISMLIRGNYHDQIGQGGLYSGEDSFGGAQRRGSRGAGAYGDAPGWGGEEQDTSTSLLSSSAEREVEIRQMLVARSERLVRRGQAPLDIDAELARLERGGASGLHGAGGAGDAALAEEVRQLVLARNERRRRQGLDALDIETEVQRTLAELNP
jgi:hypothetical protein